MSQEFVFDQEGIKNQLKQRAHGSISAVVSVFVVCLIVLLLVGVMAGTYSADLMFMCGILFVIFLVISIPVFIHSHFVFKLVDKVPKRFIISPNALFIDEVKYDVRYISEIRPSLPHRGLFSGTIRRVRLVYQGHEYMYCLGSVRAPWTKDKNDVCPQYQQFYFALAGLYPDKFRNTSYM